MADKKVKILTDRVYVCGSNKQTVEKLEGDEVSISAFQADSLIKKGKAELVVNKKPVKKTEAE